MLEYLSPSQCRKQWEFSRNRTQQEARGAAHLQRVQLGENKEGKVLGAVPGFHRPPWLSKQRESSPRKELWQRGGAGLGSATVPSASQRLCPVAAGPGAGGMDGWSSEGSCKGGPVWDEPPWEHPMDTCDTQSCFFLFLSPPSQCLSQGSTNEVSGSCSPHAAGPGRALGSWEKHLGPKSMSGLLEDGGHEGLGQQLLAWLPLAVPCDPDAWGRVWMWALRSRHCWEPSGREIWVGNVRI